MPIYTRATLKTDVAAIISGTVSDTNLNTLANKAVRDVLVEIDIASAKRRAVLSPNMFDDIYQYTCPSDLKSQKIIDVKPQINRGLFDSWTLVTEEEFDRRKEDHRLDRYGDPINVQSSEWIGANLVAISYRDMIKKILISRPIDDKHLTIDDLDAVGDWKAFGDGTNLTKDADNYVKGSACINWDINADGGTTAGIYNDSLNEFDISDYKGTGSAFVWVYITSTTNLTNFILRIGSSSSAYYYITVTTNNEGNSFEAGWNLLRFDFANKSTNGTPDDDACTYVALYMTKAATKISETDYRFDWLVLKRGNHYYVVYYSKYGWQTSAAAYLENSTADTDYLNLDTDEYELVLEKYAELCEKHLKNFDEAKIHKEAYTELASKYILDNPSEVRPLIQTYHMME